MLARAGAAAITYSLTVAPDGMSIDASSGQITWTPTADEVGNQEVEIVADDGRGDTVRQDFTVQVFAQPVNHPPVFQSLPITQVAVGTAYNYAPTVLAPSGTTLQYSLDSAPSGMSINAQTGVVSYSAATAGSFAVQIRATDSLGDSADQAFVLGVGSGSGDAVNFTSTPSGDGTATVGTLFDYLPLTTDANAQALQFTLKGQERDATANPVEPESVWSHIWRWNIGLFLVVHDEDRSKRSNEVELAVVEQLLDSAPKLPAGSVAIITPHRAQRSLFNSRLDAHASDGRPVDVIDTVERLQGGERPTVIVSATVSDPTSIEANVEFILDLNRANVAFSRVQDRLIVICARTLLNHIPAEFEHYKSAMLWKSLRELCSVVVAETQVGGHHVQILTPPPEAAKEGRL